MTEECGTSVSMKSKRFRFDKQLDLLLEHTVCDIEAQVAKHGKLDAKYQGVLAAFRAHHSFLSKHASGMSAPKVTTLRDRLNKLVVNRRAENRRNIAASGIPEEYGELEQSLDVLIQELMRRRKMEAEAKKKMDRKEQTLLDAGLSIRDSAMKRSVPSTDETASTPKQKKRKVSKYVIDLTGDKELELMQEEAVHRREMEKKLTRIG
eukprot:IDg2143t1